MMIKKIYCTDCKYFGADWNGHGEQVCNKKIGKQSNSIECVYSYIGPHFYKYNKDNNCSYYKVSFWSWLFGTQKEN